MNYRSMKLVLAISIAWASWGSVNSHAVAQEDDWFPVWIELRDGSLINALVEPQAIPWLTVEKDGTMTNSQINLREINSLELTTEPASVQVSTIRKLIDQLSDDSFKIRNDAEKELIASGGPFVELIQNAATSEELEVRYRVGRVLKKLKSADNQSIELDELYTSGGLIEGDVRDWKLVGRIGDSEFALDRTNLKSISRNNPLDGLADFSQLGQTPLKIQRQLAYDSEGGGDNAFYKSDQVHVTFETGPGDEKLRRNTQVNDMFDFRGCLLDCETDLWNVIISGFSFTGSVSKFNSIGNYYFDPESRKHFRYHGVMEITFCEPGRKNYPAAVNQFACFLEIVMPRQTIIEAYNAAGHRIAMQEAASDRSSFIGLVTSEPITRVRIMPNKYLDLGEDLNEDFAVDDLCFSEPVVVNDINTTDKHQVLLKSGERISCEGFRFVDGKVNVIDQRFGDKGLTYDISDLISLLGPQQSTELTAEGANFVMLDDGSVVKAELDDDVSTEFDMTIGYDEIVGFWSGNHVLYPQPADLDGQAKVVAVYPTCRIKADDYAFEDGKFVLDAGSISRVHQLPELDMGHPEPQGDVQAEGLQLELGNSPSVWFKIPSSVDYQAGLIRLRDGQQFVIGGSSEFALVSTDGESLVIENNGVEVTIPLSDVLVIRFAQ